MSASMEPQNCEHRIKLKTSGFSNYIFRDLVLWFAFIFFLPVLLFIVYQITKENTATNPSIQAIFPNENLENLEINKQMPMKRVYLNNYPNSICNDGSTASYYIRMSSSKSRIWIVHLDGGYFCYNKQTCEQRYLNSFNLTSSYGSNKYKYGQGILSSDPFENKYWFDANIV